MEREIAFEFCDVPFHWPSAIRKREGSLKSGELLLQTTCEIGDLNHPTLLTKE
jgi:hypothetical protein